MVVLTADDIAAAIGLPFAASTDEQWAQLCADATNEYVNALPIVSDPAKAGRALLGATMLAVDSYHRRPAGAIAPDFSGETLIGGAIGSPVWPVVSRYLEIGSHQLPWIA